jgi:uncharacterized membrane protein YgcG
MPRLVVGRTTKKLLPNDGESGDPYGFSLDMPARAPYSNLMTTVVPYRRWTPWAVFFGLLASLLLAGTTARADVNDFSFSSYDADYYLSRDSRHISHLHVVEHLTAEFPANDQNHGILRAIPNSYDGHDIYLQVLSVTNDAGASLPFSRSTSNHNLVLKIGDSSQYVHGRQTYVITYDMDNVTAKPDATRDGFFWDINGDAWSQTFAHVTARIHADSALLPALKPGSLRCFTGARGSTAANCAIQAGPAGATEQVITATATRPLTAGETLTAELDFQPGTFAGYTVPGNQLFNWALIALLGYVLPIALTLWLTVRHWWRYGRDPKGRGVIIPQYTPPQDVSVLAASAILTERFKPQAITATILDLAIRGYLKIYEVKQERLLIGDKTSYQLELVKPPTSLRPNDTAVLNLLFGASGTPGAKVSLDDLANKLYTEARQIGKDVSQQVTDAGYFRTNPDKAKWRYTAVGFVLIFIPFIIQSPYTIGLAICGLITLAMANAMPARTAGGVEVRDYLLGLKQFITIAEAERIKVLQSPQGSLTEKIDTGDNTQLVKLYEKLLPYAMLFGIEKAWAKQFAKLYQQPPDWYSGASSFNAGYFAGSLGSFGTQSTASFTPPSNSAGGGSAGGGGGGGGGGGW